MEVGFLLSWVTVLAAPILGWVLAYLTNKHSPTMFRRLCWASAGTIGVTVILTLAGVRSSFALMNLLFWLACYFAYSVLASAVWTVKSRWVRFPLGILAYAAFLPGYVLGTVGILGLMFILGDYLSPPMEVTQLEPGLLCEVTGWGNATSDEGYEITLYRHWPALPGLRLEVGSLNVNETDPVAGQSAATCTGVARANGY